MIDKYLISNCLINIEELNERLSYLNREMIKELSDKEYQESDLVFLIGFPFKHLAKFNSIGADICIKTLAFGIQVKFIKNTKSENGYYSGSANWKDTFLKDFEWLCNEIRNGKKGKSAFILGWFNVVDSFSQIMQLGKCSSSGKSGGGLPEVNEDKLKLLPFLNIEDGKTKTKDIKYMYSEAYNKKSITVKGLLNNTVDCIFLGNETDVFHFAIYY